MQGSGEPEDTDPYRPRRREEGYPSLVVRLEPESFFPSEYVLARSSRRDKTRGNYIIASWGNSGAMTPAQRESECQPEPAPAPGISRSEPGLGIQEIAWTWKSVKTWQMGPSSEWEARGARCSQRGRQGNGESFHKHRNIYMKHGLRTGGGGNAESLTVHFSIVSMSEVWTDWGQMMWQCDIIRVGGTCADIWQSHPAPAHTSSQASGECDELMEELSQCGNRFSMDMANILPQLLTQTRPRLALQCSLVIRALVQSGDWWA